jgi:serine/threonine protein kinase
MNTGIACPKTEELRQLLEGTLSGDRQEEYTHHMDSCTGCQAKLEEIATEGTNLSRVVEQLHVAEPLAESAYWPALQALDKSMQRTIVPNETVRERDDSLRFLQPASDSAYIGRMAHFDVMRILGRGGMGVVLEAYDSKLQRNVALKVLAPELAGDDTARQRFCREARAAASITHENVVAVHQVEKSGDDGLPYLVMQFIAGESLEQRLQREKKLPLREIVRIGMQAAHGLAAAHAKGLVHRDIKPGNILLEVAHDNVKLTDFGLARVVDDVRLTRTGSVSGTPLYMAPEQAMGKESDERSDLFSLGATLYEMCAGQPPFSGNSALAILKQIADVKHRPLRELNPAIPEWLDHTIDGLLAKKPADRIQTAAHLAELFEFEWALMKATSEEVPTVCKIEQAKRARRNRLIAAGVGVTFLSLGLFAGSFFSNRNSADPNKSNDNFVESAVSTAKPLAVLSANSSGAVWSVAFDQTGDSVAMAVEDGSVRLWDVPSQGVKATLNAHRGIAWASLFSKKGETLATSGDDGLIKLWKPGEAEPFKVFDQVNTVRGLAFAHDGRSVFAGDRRGGLRIWSLDADLPVVEAQQAGSVLAVAVSPDDETLATAGNDKIVRILNAKTLAQKLVLEGHAGPVNGLSFSPDGRRLASVGWDKTVRIWDAGSGQLIKFWEGLGGEIWGVAYSPDGTRLATGGISGAVKLWDAQTGDLLTTWLGHKTAIHTVAFNFDGTRLASGGRDGAVRIW